MHTHNIKYVPTRNRTHTHTRTHREGEVERLRHAELSRLDGVDVPRDDGEDDAVDQQHQHDVQQRDVVVDVHRAIEVTPLHADACGNKYTSTCTTFITGIGARRESQLCFTTHTLYMNYSPWDREVLLNPKVDYCTDT